MLIYTIINKILLTNNFIGKYQKALLEDILRLLISFLRDFNVDFKKSSKECFFSMLIINKKRIVLSTARWWK